MQRISVIVHFQERQHTALMSAFLMNMKIVIVSIMKKQIQYHKIKDQVQVSIDKKKLLDNLDLNIH